MKTLLADLDLIKQDYLEKSKIIKRRIIVCAGTGCIANGSSKVYNKFQSLIKETGLDLILDLSFEKHSNEVIHLTESGCQGFCQMGPLVDIEPDGILYVGVKEKDVEEIVNETLLNNKLVERLLYHDPKTHAYSKGHKEINFYAKQHRFVLKQCGMVDPNDINEYIALDGYGAAKKAILEMTDKDVCDELVTSGLRGRGGGGFPTGRKWESTRIQKSDDKYVICNGDEGDPGAFMDRSVMEGNPHSVLEGMMIAARAIGANKGYIYVRLEYPLAVRRIKKAAEDARKLGLLGQNIFGSYFSFDVEVMEGAGAFVCGEETALMSSIEGKRGMPSPKPPFPAEKGLWGKPTVINNVETLASVPLIIKDGARSFRQLGSATSPGTKTFALTGHVSNTGLIEVPFGTTLRTIIFDIGGGVTTKAGKIDNDAFKAVQIGGPSGGCLTKEHLDLPLDFDSLGKIGAMIGSGGLVVMNNQTCMVQMAKFFMTFTQNESCGKCVLCREGTKQMLALLEDITEGRATIATIDLLQQLASAVKKGSLCGLGKTAPNPVLAMIKQFREEFDAHVISKRCPTGQCKSLSTPHIIEEKCKGCGMCIKVCPVGAITGEKRQAHVINEVLCIKCGACFQTCRLKAIEN
ncbi:MAG: NADH-ubiquinone oxidoreductase-F iron-sulfur binding region domain-containing protein [bacterium]